MGRQTAPAESTACGPVLIQNPGYAGVVSAILGNHNDYKHLLLGKIADGVPSAGPAPADDPRVRPARADAPEPADPDGFPVPHVRRRTARPLVHGVLMPRLKLTVAAKPRPVNAMPERMVALDRLQPAPDCLERPPSAEDLAGEPRHDGPIVVRSIPIDPKAPVIVLAGLERLARLRQAGNVTAYVRVAEPATPAEALTVGWSAAPEPRRDPVRLGQGLRALLPMLWTGGAVEAARLAVLANITGFTEPDVERVLLLAEAVEATESSAAGYTREALAAMPLAALRRLLTDLATPPDAPPVTVHDDAAPAAAASAPDLPPLPTAAEVAAMPPGAFRREVAGLLPAGATIKDLGTAFQKVDAKRPLTYSAFEKTLSGGRNNPATIERLLLAIRALHHPAAWPEVTAAVAERRQERAAGKAAATGKPKRAAPAAGRNDGAAPMREFGPVAADPEVPSGDERPPSDG